MSLTKLFDKIREKNMVKTLPKPKTRPETDEEFEYRAFHTPFYCKNCGTVIYPKWVPKKFSQIDGVPYLWENVSICRKCGYVTQEVTIQWQNYPESWHIRPIRNIYRKDIIIEDQTQENKSGV